MKRNIYILNEVEMKREGNVLKIDGVKIPISAINNVFVFSNASITKGAKSLILKNKRAIFYLNSRYELVGILVGPFFNNYVNRRIKQYENRNSLEIAKEIVLLKLKAIEKVFGVELPKKDFNSINSYQELLGVEGVGSSLMFKAFKKEIEKIGIKEFQKREYRPVKDRVNSLLSFLYTLYYAFVYSELAAFGFDPYVGFLHKKKGEHAVLCSDVMEEARVYLTYLAIEILKEIYPEGFDGLYLNKEYRKKVILMFDEFLLNYENNILKRLITLF